MGLTIKRIFLVIFLAVLGGCLVAILLENSTMQQWLKPVLIPPLACYFITGTSQIRSPLKKFLLFALFFSWAGDILLMYQDRNELFFMLGLSAFLLAHIFYIVFFHRIRVRKGIPVNVFPVFLVAAYYIALMVWLAPYLGDMQLPVRMYGIFICFMLILALHIGLSKKVHGGRVMLAGALLFVLSDTLLAVNKFYSAFSFAEFFIISTYASAQFLIVYGATAFLWQANTR